MDVQNSRKRLGIMSACGFQELSYHVFYSMQVHNCPGEVWLTHAIVFYGSLNRPLHPIILSLHTEWVIHKTLCNFLRTSGSD